MTAEQVDDLRARADDAEKKSFDARRRIDFDVNATQLLPAAIEQLAQGKAATRARRLS